MATATARAITAKLDLMFDAIDTDRDGHVDWSDHQRLIDRYLNTYKVGKDDRRAHALVVAYQMYWIELLRHAGGGSRLDREQYRRANRALSLDTSRFNMVEGIPHAVFDIMDTDGDDSIGQAEFRRYLQVWGVSDRYAINMFGQLDIDGAGVVSRREFVHAAREFFYSSDPCAPGSMLFGRLGI
ncbi:EF-hand domain-containing protein [Streptomyces minutiscleroticus]|nr:EF-hand domain-containing protein [Streptomyces minutiscleroticus]